MEVGTKHSLTMVIRYVPAGAGTKTFCLVTYSPLPRPQKGGDEMSFLQIAKNVIRHQISKPKLSPTPSHESRASPLPLCAAAKTSRFLSLTASPVQLCIFNE
ncbi:hypothetical protein BTVI_69925 [Pitangus sulphuratus]|nr:hypothetical protein BTVI_69925 [Pitangus sulphuratus]